MSAESPKSRILRQIDVYKKRSKRRVILGAALETAAGAAAFVEPFVGGVIAIFGLISFLDAGWHFIAAKQLKHDAHI